MVLAFQRWEKVGIFLSDIGGAFDGVDAKKLVAKLKSFGVCDTFVELIASHLTPLLQKSM